MESGGLPLTAERRLAAVGSREAGTFTSDLSVSEYLLASHLHLEPLSQVMGSSVYHVGWQGQPYWSSQELHTVSAAYNQARQLALGRLEAEARLLGAHAVIGVRVRRTRWEWAAHLIEFQAIGTAVRRPGAPAPERPALTNLSGQDTWALLAAGQRPLGVMGGSCVFYVVSSWQTQRAMQGGRFFGGAQNQELVDFTQGLQAARHLALRQLHAEARALGAAGLVGVVLDQEQRAHEVERSNSERTDLIASVHALGTAVAAAEAAAVPPIELVLPLSGAAHTRPRPAGRLTDDEGAP
jgi:uncharacterized protein YbjQ (UPF0145 family)